MPRYHYEMRGVERQSRSDRRKLRCAEFLFLLTCRFEDLPLQRTVAAIEMMRTGGSNDGNPSPGKLRAGAVLLLRALEALDEVRRGLVPFPVGRAGLVPTR